METIDFEDLRRRVEKVLALTREAQAAAQDSLVHTRALLELIGDNKSPNFGEQNDRERKNALKRKT